MHHNICFFFLDFYKKKFGKDKGNKYFIIKIFMKILNGKYK